MVVLTDSKEIIYALKNKYSPEVGEWAFLEQVGKSISDSYNTWADAIVVGMWKSRGHEIIGFEVKTSRQDWLREKRKPSKADGVGKFCHRFYLVVGDESIVKEGELPMNWGLMVPHTKNSLRIKKEAVIIKNPEPATMGFMCAILRRAMQQCLPEKRLQREYRRGLTEGEKIGQNWNKKQLEWKEKQNQSLIDKIEHFEKEAGFKIDEGWNKPEEVGKILKMILEGNYERYLQKLEDMKERLMDMSKTVGIELNLHRELDKNK